MANPASTRPIVDQSVVTAVTAAVSTRTATVSARISSLTIGNDGDYRTADFLLVELRHARKLAEEIFAEKIRTPILEPTRKALDGLYTLERELTKAPFDAIEKTLKAKMAAWQEAERYRIEQERLTRRREELRLLHEAEEARRKIEETERAALEAKRAADMAAERARTKEQREAAERQAQQARSIAEQVGTARTIEQRISAEAAQARLDAIEAESQKVVKGVGSRVTVKRVPVVTGMRVFLEAILAGKVPEICIEVNEEVLAEYWGQDAGIVSSWPGVTVEEITTVGGR
jgi:septal ring factor EnvC (AmiA/AmiB activator)